MKTLTLPARGWSEGRMPSTTNFEGGKATGEVWQGAESLFTTNSVSYPPLGVTTLEHRRCSEEGSFAT